MAVITVAFVSKLSTSKYIVSYARAFKKINKRKVNRINKSLLKFCYYYYYYYLVLRVVVTILTR